MTDAPAVIDVVRAAVPAASIEPGSSDDMPTMYVDREHLLEVLTVLRDDPALQFAFLSDMTAVDLLPAEPRYEIVYHLACLGAAYATGTPAPARRLRLKVQLSGHDHAIPSVTGIYPSANWPEREVFDLFGIAFSDHPDLRRILTAEDWTGHPLRKDYPVQVRKTPQAWSPIQVSAEEFAEHVRAERERAKREIEAESARD